MWGCVGTCVMCVDVCGCVVHYSRVTCTVWVSVQSQPELKTLQRMFTFLGHPILAPASGNIRECGVCGACGVF